MILSLFGWNATETPKVLACEACHTRCTYIPSFGFRKTGVRDDDDDVFMEDDEEASFDTIQAHKWYCYWVDPEHNEMQEVGWRIFYKSLTSGSGGQVNQSQPQSDQQDASLSSAVSERMEVCDYFCSRSCHVDDFSFILCIFQLLTLGHTLL